MSERRPHRLDPLLRPRSIAVVGASTRSGSVGRQTVVNLLKGGFPGTLHPVNPRYDDVEGLRCYPSLESLPGPVEHVIFAVGDTRIEAALDSAIDCGAGAVTIFSSLVLAQDSDPPLRERLRDRVRQAGLLVCGGNGMGFYNFADRVWACGFQTREHEPGGEVALISHSGSGMSGIVDVEERIRFNLAVSTGQELGVGMHEYIDYALELPGTRVIGLFMETARDSDGLTAALAKANARGVPVVAIKVGRSELAARLAVSHSGAMAGREAAYQALFERYGVVRVSDLDELATALILFAQPHPVGPGALVSLHDSGGERQLLIDLAETLDVPLTALSPATVARLEALLDPGLPAVNPLDAWSAGGEGYHEVMADCLSAMLADPGAALGAVIHARNAGSAIYPGYIEYLRRAHAASGKPLFLVAGRQGTGSDPLVIQATREGFPVLDGLTPFLKGVRGLLGWRDFRSRPAVAPPPAPAGAAGRWRSRLARGGVLDEAESSALLVDFGLPMNPLRLVGSEAEALAAARELGFPVALKTAAAGITHKSQLGGVRLALADEATLRDAWSELSARLGPRVLVVPMVAGGVEMLLGVSRDEQFGPLLTLGIGGIHTELLHDVVHALPPIDAATARRLLDGLELRGLLEGPRGTAPVDVDAYCEAAARLSVLALELGELVEEIDLNPVIVTPAGCVAVDALVVARAQPPGSRTERRFA